MTHVANRRKVSRHGRNTLDPAIPALLQGAELLVLNSMKESLELPRDERGHSLAGLDNTDVEGVVTRDLMTPLPAQQRFTYVNEDSYSVQPTDFVVLVDVAAGSKTLTLPLSTTPFISAPLFIFAVGAAGSNVLTLFPQGGETINGNASRVLGSGPTNYQGAILLPCHSGWIAGVLGV